MITVITRAISIMMMMNINLYTEEQNVRVKRRVKDLTESLVYNHGFRVRLISVGRYDFALKYYCSYKAIYPPSV